MAEHLTAAHARRASGHPPIWPLHLDAQYTQAAGEDGPLGLHADEHLRREGHALESGLRRKGPTNEQEPHDAQSMLLSAFTEALLRGKWLLGLLIVQSTSSFVLDRYRDLLREHLVVTLFLTMLVGAGGNAGNQSAIKVIRALVRSETEGGE